MTNLIKDRFGISLLLIFFLFSCGGGDGNTGGHVTEIDTSGEREEIPEIISEKYSMDLNPGSAVKVDLEENSNFIWTDFRNQLQAQPEAIGKGFHMGENEVTSAWEPLDDKYSFQRKYLYRDNELWLQTYYRENSSATTPDSNGDGQILTHDIDEPVLQGLWNKMEDMANDIKSQ